LTLYDFLSRLEGVKGRSIQYTARCPAHADHMPIVPKARYRKLEGLAQYIFKVANMQHKSQRESMSAPMIEYVFRRNENVFLWELHVGSTIVLLSKIFLIQNDPSGRQLCL